MQYNQPFDQPSNPNAPYVDGNPSAGIQGSIVPAAGIEFDQREVVEVINRANARGYKDFSGTPCAPPINADLQQLRKAIEGFIDSTPVPSWYIDTPVTWTVHGAGAMYPDLNTALEQLSKFIITHNGSVTIEIAAGRWTYNTNIVLDHPNADRITITGANLLSYPVPSDFAVTGYTATARANDRVNTLNRLRTRFATELDFVGGGMIVNQSSGVTIQNIFIVGDRGGGGGLAQVSGWMNTNNISVCYGAGSGIGIGGGSLNMINGSFLSSSGCVSHGIGIDAGGNMWHGSNTQIFTTSNDGNGIGAGFNCGSNGYAMLISQGNAWSGVMCSVMGQFQLGSNCQFNTNAQGGVSVDMGNFYCDSTNGGPQMKGNAGWGVFATVGSVVNIFNSSISGNTTGAISAYAGSVVWITGSSISGTVTPTLGALSADGSIISN